MRTIIKQHTLSLALSLAAVMSMSAAESGDSTLTILDRITAHRHHVGALLDLAWNNPAVKPFQHRYSLSSVEASFSVRDESEPLDVQRGDHESIWAFDAESYMKHNNATLWGKAYYNNGYVGHMVWNETSDVGVVYPYVIADSVGGKKLNLERYSFMGGYAASRGKWVYGASLGYTAGLYYRNVDPRPRNVTASLNLGVGLGYSVLRKYVLAASLHFLKYKQTNEVSFYSELGSDKLFHLTGFTSRYTRFDALGTTCNYKGIRWSGTLDFHPVDQRGLSVSVAAGRMKLDNVLPDLNSLAMAQVTHNDVRAEVASMHQDWAVKVHVRAARRVGTENVFGDASGAIYQQIGSLDQYFENGFSAGLSGLWQRFWAGYGMTVIPSLSYNHLNVVYVDPASRKLLNDLSCGLDLKASAPWGRTRQEVDLGVACINPVKTEFFVSDTDVELSGLRRAIENQYAWQSKAQAVVKVGVSSHVALRRRQALNVAVDWLHGFFHNSIYSNYLSTSIAFEF